jgi:hypothetical protein
VGVCDGERFVQGGQEVRFGWVVGPQGNHSVGQQVTGEVAQPCGTVKVGVTGVQDVSRGVVDIQQDGVESSPGRGRVEARCGLGHGEEVPALKSRASIDAQADDIGQQAAFMPPDYLLKRLHDEQ